MMMPSVAHREPSEGGRFLWPSSAYLLSRPQEANAGWSLLDVLSAQDMQRASEQSDVNTAAVIMPVARTNPVCLPPPPGSN